MTPAAEPTHVARGSPAFRRITLAFFFMGFATFALLYSVQPLLPLFAQNFGVGAASASLVLSLSTIFLAVGVVMAAAVSERFGRRKVIFVSVASASTLHLLAAVAPDWPSLLAMRALEGLALGGVPAVAMTYLSEEIDPAGLGAAVGLYVAGSGFGGMSGRLAAGLLSDAWSWHAALAALGGLGLVFALAFIALVPPSRNFLPRRGLPLSFHFEAWAGHLRNRALRPLFLVGLTSLGAFVVLYNYAAFRLTGPPYNLSQSQLGLLFSVYIFGMGASSLGGALADRMGRRRVLPAAVALAALGVALTALPWIPVIVAGVILTTTGFFAGHTVASSWVGPQAEDHKGHAASLYTLAFYVGSSVAGTAGGWFWTHAGWAGVSIFSLSLWGVALAAALAAGTRARG